MHRAFSFVKQAGFQVTPELWALTMEVFFIITHVLFSVFCALFVCKCVLYYCHRVSTQLQLKINIL
jgi:hypothetical protein